MKLYEISDTIRAIEEILEQKESENLVKAMDEIKGDFKEKLKNIGIVIRKFESYENSIDEEIKRLQDLKKHYKTQKESLKNYVAYAMELAKQDKVETDLFKFSFRKSTSVEIFNEEKNQEEFKKKIVQVKISKTDIAKALKEGKEIEGAQLKQSKSLQIQ